MVLAKQPRMEFVGTLDGVICPLPVNFPGRLNALTPAERRVLSLLLAGYSNKEISSGLGRAEPTIKHQVSSCLRKFGQPSRARLIAALR